MVWPSGAGHVYHSKPYELITPFVFCFCFRKCLVSIAVFCRSLFVFISFSFIFLFGHCCFPSLTYSFRLPLLYFQSFIATAHYLSCIFKLLLSMIVGFTTSYAISVYHNWCCEFESPSRRGVQHYVIQCVSDMRQAGGFLWVPQFPPPIKLTATI